MLVVGGAVFFERDANPRCIECVAFFFVFFFIREMHFLPPACLRSTCHVLWTHLLYLLFWMTLYWMIIVVLTVPAVETCDRSVQVTDQRGSKREKEKLFGKLRLSLNPEIWIYSLSTRPCSPKITIIVIIYDLWASWDSESETEHHSKRSFTLKQQKCEI